MRTGTIFFLLGVSVFQLLPVLPQWYWCLLLLPFFALPWAISRQRRAAVLALAIAAAGLLWAWVNASVVLASHLDPALEGRDLQLSGRVASLPECDGRRCRFDLDSEWLTHDGRTDVPPGRVRLSWYGRVPELRPGQRWSLTVRLKRPHGFANPGGFDYERWLFRHRIRATGYVRSGGDNRRLDGGTLAAPVDRLRQRLDRAIAATLEGTPHAGLIAALAIGNRRGISPQEWRVLRLTGTSHLMAISGLHIGMVAGLLFLLVRRLWSLSGRAVQRLAAPRAAALAAIAAAVLYAALAGFSVPTRRAVVMAAVVMGALYRQRPWRPDRVLALALLLVLLLDPLAVLGAGFWLSFAAVALILYGMGGRLGRPGLWWRWGRVQWLLALGLSPLLLAAFQQVPLVAPLANLVAVPLVGLAVVPLVLAGTLCLPLLPAVGGFLLHLAAALLGRLWSCLAWLADLLPAHWSALAPPLWSLPLSLAGLLWLLAPRGWPSRWLGALWLLPALLVRPPAPGPGAVWLTVLDVGQGLATVVRTAGHTLVYDTGPAYGPGFDAGSAVLVPFLRASGVRGVDTLMVGHGDSDHSGGAASLLASMPVARVMTSAPERVPAPEPVRCVRGQQWRWDGIVFRVVGPPRGAPEGNDASCVLRVEAPGGALLLPGDIEAPAEEELLGAEPQALPARVLVAPHHGSATSSTRRFVAAVRPQAVVYSVGYRNRYGFPASVVAGRYRAAGARGYGTDRLGAVTLRLAPDGHLGVRGYRQVEHRYWQE